MGSAFLGRTRTNLLSLLATIRDCLDGLVHASAQHDAQAAARHRAFILPRLLGSAVALAAVPLYLAVRGMPSLLELVIFAWLIVPVVIAYFLSRTGQYDRAYVLSSLALTALVTVVVSQTGGISSYAAAWFIVVPLEAALSGSRRVVVVASSLAFAAMGYLAISGALGLIPQAGSWEHQLSALMALGLVSSAYYVTGLALARDRFARGRTEAVLAADDPYRSLASSMADVLTRHGDNGAVSFVSPAAEGMFGVNTGALLNHGLFDRVMVADRPAYLKAIGDAAVLGGTHGAEFRVRRQSGDDRHDAGGEYIWIEMRCRPIDESLPDRDQVRRRDVVAVLRDVTKRKQQDIASGEAQAEAARTNAAKSRFLATMSHELRTPLNAIIGFSDMLGKEEALRIDRARRQDYARLINESGQHLLEVVNGLLDMTKIESGTFVIRPEPFAPGPVIARSCELLRQKAREAGVDVNLRLADDLPEIVADRRALSQIVLNLLSNAIKFTNPGGRIAVKATIVDGALQVAVSDTGLGIAAADLPRIGDPFFQACASYDRRHDGTGLGLSIVKGLVALHGGTIGIRSRIGEGTCVTVTLPFDCGGRALPSTANATVHLKPVPHESENWIEKIA